MAANAEVITGKITEGDEPKIIIESRVRATLDMLNLGQFKVSADFFDQLNARVAELIVDAATRCKGNGRVTLQSHDL